MFNVLSKVLQFENLVNNIWSDIKTQKFLARCATVVKNSKNKEKSNLGLLTQNLIKTHSKDSYKGCEPLQEQKS